MTQAAYDPLALNSELIRGLLVHAADGVRFGGRDQLSAMLYYGNATELTNVVASHTAQECQEQYHSRSLPHSSPGSLVRILPAHLIR